MGMFSRLGKKLSDGYNSGMRLGAKVLGEGARIGHKITQVGDQVIKDVKGIPIVSTALATPISMAEKGLDVVRKGTKLAERGSGLLGDIDNVVRKGRDTLNRLEKNDMNRR